MTEAEELRERVKFLESCDAWNGKLLRDTEARCERLAGELDNLCKERVALVCEVHKLRKVSSTDLKGSKDE